MVGVEIISTFEKVVEKTGTMIGFWISFFIVLSLGILFIVKKTQTNINKTGDIDKQFIFHSSLIVFIISMFCGGLGLLAKTEPSKYETLYEVAVADEVYFNEFVEKYEIIEIKENTYIVKDRT